MLTLIGTKKWGNLPSRNLAPQKKFFRNAEGEALLMNETVYLRKTMSIYLSAIVLADVLIIAPKIWEANP